MPYEVNIKQPELNLTCKLGVFNFKKNQIITDENFGKELANICPNIFKKVLTQQPKKVEEIVIEEPIITTPTIIEEELTEETEDDMEETETTTDETKKTFFNKRGRKPKGK